MKVAILLSCLVLAACVGQPLRPAAEISRRPLDAGVDSGIGLKMVAFAARDRICAAMEQQLNPPVIPPPGHPKWTPIPAVGHGQPIYSSCMNGESVTACEATEQDLRTVRTLLERDPRLSALLSFDELLARLKQQCPAFKQLATDAKSVRSWSPRALWRCEDRHQPVLLTTAVLLRTLPPRDEQAHLLWFGGCIGTVGYTFLQEHCGFFRRRARPEQGVEAYFCPQIWKHFGS